MVATTRKGSSSSPAKLKFSDKLVGKGLTTDALQKKLKKLASELAELDQDNVDTKSIAPVCKELISPSILLHKDKGVKAYAACCLADILRLFAPDAPYTGPELRDIFQFFFRQLSMGLKGSTEPYYNEYFHLLESLSTVKSVVLVCDIPQAEELMTQIFRDLFGLVRQSLAKNIEMFMSDILIALIDECQVLPTEVLECIMAQFMDKNTRMEQPAFRLAVEVCNATSDKLQRHVCQYFTDNIVNHAREEEFDEIARCHELIKRLNAACPALLHNVVPQLEEELRVDEAEIRTLATQVLSEMFADASDDLEKKYPSTWSLWLLRKNDKSLQVRLAFVEGCKGLLLHHKAELRQAIEEALHTKLLDPDEKVRAAVCKLYSQLDYETALHYVSEEQLRAVGDRVLDKKQIVRQEALVAIGKLFEVAYPQIESLDAAAIRHFAWIPHKVMQAVTANLEVKQVAVQVVAQYILPFPAKADEEVAWTDRLLVVLRYLEKSTLKTALSISNIKYTRPTPFEHYVQCCIENNGGIIDENEEVVKKQLNATVRAVSALYGDPQKAAEDLRTFAKLNEQRLYKLLKTCQDPHTDLKSLVKAYNEFIRRLEQASPAIFSTMRAFILQCSLWIVNTSSIPTLIKRLSQGVHAAEKARTTPEKLAEKLAGVTSQAASSSQMTIVMASNAAVLLTMISKCQPVLFRPHVSELVKATAEDKSERVVHLCLQALAAISRSEPALAPSDKRTLERLTRHVRGSKPKLAKYATRILAHTKDRDALCAETVEFITTNLPKADPDKLAAHIAVLVEMIRFAPDAFEQRSETIVEFLLKEVLMRPCLDDGATMEVGEDVDEWEDEDKLPPRALAKSLALKVCRHRCLVHANSESAADMASPVIKLLVTLLEKGGALTPQSADGPTVKSRLRLQAATSLLHLATVEKFAEAIAPDFVLLALTIQDSCYNVRDSFLKKLMLLVNAGKLPARFNVIFFLTVHDPEEDIRTQARGFVHALIKRSRPDVRLSNWEVIFIRLLHIIAHHPDFGLEELQVLEMAKYIREYLSLVATADNISLLYHVAQKCKTIRDAESHVFSERLYATSELAQELIKRHTKVRQWSLPIYPGKVKLPSDIFRPLPSDGARSTILKTVYLPDEIVKKLDEFGSSHPREKQRAERKTTTKRKAPTTVNGSSKRSKGTTRRRKHYSSDEEEGDDDDDDAISEDGDERQATSSPVRSAPAQSDSGSDGEENDEGEANDKDLGRGARSRAKARAQKKTRRRTKPKSASSTNE
ncbi:PDS5 [Sanghuangporus sanghuang]